MDEVLLKIGFPVNCRKCRVEGRVRPQTDYGGWYKSTLLRKSNRWFCPEHHDIGKQMDNGFYARYATPEPVEAPEETVDELYKLLD